MFCDSLTRLSLTLFFPFLLKTQPRVKSRHDYSFNTAFLSISTPVFLINFIISVIILSNQWSVVVCTSSDNVSNSNLRIIESTSNSTLTPSASSASASASSEGKAIDLKSEATGIAPGIGLGGLAGGAKAGGAAVAGHSEHASGAAGIKGAKAGKLGFAAGGAAGASGFSSGAGATGAGGQ